MIHYKTNEEVEKMRVSALLVSKSLTEIAYDCGYFDQNHFIKEFKQFAYNTPSTSTLDEYYFFNMLILFSRYYTSPNSKF